MKNIDKVRQMTPKELIAFLKSDNCNRCTYNGTNCNSDFCTEGMIGWLKQESELTIEDMRSDFNDYCNSYKDECDSCSTNCYYFRVNNHKHWNNDECEIAYIIRNFNIIDDKITRR